MSGPMATGNEGACLPWNFFGSHDLVFFLHPEFEHSMLIFGCSIRLLLQLFRWQPACLTSSAYACCVDVYMIHLSWFDYA